MIQGGTPALSSLFQEHDFSGKLRLISFHSSKDQRGILTAYGNDALPFVPCRSFVVTHVPRGTVRGGHAHEQCEQVLICLSGEVKVNVVFESKRAGVTLNSPSVGLFIAAGVWAEQIYELENSILLVFASLPYNRDSYM